MQDGTASGTLERSNDGDDIYQAVVADLASLIARVQAGLAMIETAVAGEAAATLQGPHLQCGRAGRFHAPLSEGRRGSEGLRYRPGHRPAFPSRADDLRARPARFRLEPLSDRALSGTTPAFSNHSLSEAGFDPGRYRSMPARKCGAGEEGVKICRAGVCGAVRPVRMAADRVSRAIGIAPVSSSSCRRPKRRLASCRSCPSGTRYPSPCR